jgi:uncharacterized membrane-anchored protein YhcB (DUF1043 family)
MKNTYQILLSVEGRWQYAAIAFVLGILFGVYVIPFFPQ